MFTAADRQAIIDIVTPLIEQATRQGMDQAITSTPTTTWRPATCITVSDTGVASVVIDGDTAPVDVGVIGTRPASGARVMVVFVPPSAVFCLAVVDYRPKVYTQGGLASSVIGAGAAGINALVVPDQGCAGVVVVYAQVRIDQSVATDVFQLTITNCDFINYEHGPASPGGGVFIHQQTGYAAMPAGAAKTFGANVNRDSGTGTGTSYLPSTAPNFMIATFYPT